MDFEGGEELSQGREQDRGERIFLEAATLSTARISAPDVILPFLNHYKLRSIKKKV
jgi:hypothetical protein